MSKDYPKHEPFCGCSGCYASNGEQNAKNRLIDELIRDAEKVFGRPSDEIRGCLEPFKWYHPHAVAGEPMFDPRRAIAEESKAWAEQS